MMNARPKKFSLAYLASLLIQCHISQYTHYSNFKLAAECQENATLVAGFFSQNKIISSQQFIYQVQFIAWTCRVFYLCQYEERIYL